MYRAILFDFYGVWGPDNFAAYLSQAEKLDPELAKEIDDIYRQYFSRLINIEEVIRGINYKFRLYGVVVNPTELVLNEQAFPEDIIHFIQYLHGHFMKVGVLANLGRQEYHLLEDLQAKYDLFDTVTGPDKTGKPLLSRETFAVALQDLGEPPEDCLVISGSKQYISFAKSLGMQTHKFEGFPKLIETTRQELEGSGQ